MTEQAIQQQIRLALSGHGVRMFRNNTGALRDANNRLVRFGLCEGSADLIGLRRLELPTGEHVAQFVAVEVKTPTGRLTEQQRRFLQMVTDHGGLAGVARSIEEARELLERGPPWLQS